MIIYSFIHFGFLLFDGFVINIIIVCHKLVDGTLWREFYDSVCHSVNKLMVMRCKQYVAFKRNQVVVECLNGFQIQMVCRGVQYEAVSVLQLHAGYHATHFLTTTENVYFLQDCGIEIDGVKFFGLAYNHQEDMIPDNTDVVITHEPPVMILDRSAGTHWGNAPLRNRIMEVKPRYHLFGHAHGGYGILKQDGIVFSNAALLDDMNRLVRKPRPFMF